jgi:hypothetical protein
VSDRGVGANTRTHPTQVEHCVLTRCGFGVAQRGGPRFILHLNSLENAHALPQLSRTVRTWLMGEWLSRNNVDGPEV